VSKIDLIFHAKLETPILTLFKMVRHKGTNNNERINTKKKFNLLSIPNFRLSDKY